MIKSSIPTGPVPHFVRLAAALAIGGMAWGCSLQAFATAQETPPAAAKADQPAEDKALADALQAQDTDGNGTLNEQEYLKFIPATEAAKARQEFVIYDLDQDKQISLEELRTIPSRVPVERRSPLPSPFARRVSGHMNTIVAAWPEWDADKDEVLSESEFQAAGLANSIPGFTMTTWIDWDRDGDGRLSHADCRRLLEAGYGMTRLDGTPLHLPSGQVVYWWHFKELDVDHDDRLTAKEYELEGADKVGRDIRLERDDTDQNGELSFKEWAASSGRRVDPVSEFLAIDKNLDGLLDSAELHTGTAAWLKKVTGSVFPGFDLNRDGVLSLHEYWATMVVNRVENWLQMQTDLDHDGRLGPHEFAWLPGPELALLKAEYFRRLDVNHDGLLTLSEYPFIIDTTKVPQAVLMEVSFKAFDTDADAMLNEAELLAPIAPPDQPRAKQEMAVFDLDRNQKLTFEEYLRLPSRGPLEVRGALPSPFAKLVTENVATITTGWLTWDKDKNDKLNEAEFQAAKLTALFQGLEKSTLKDWDRDGDGSVSQADCRLLLEAGYGIRRLNGQLLHLPTGHTVYWWHFKELDVDRNESLTAKEFESESPDVAGRKARFEMNDTDKNGEISFKEWAESPHRHVDAVAEFMSIDKNQDGRVDPAELQAGTANWLGKLTPSVFPGFDLDRDGALTLHEYWATLLANRVENWLQLQRDLDNDGRLGPTEFAWLPGPELALLKAEYFRRFDVDRDGFLKLEEFPFVIDTSKVSPEQTVEAAFRSVDKNSDGQLQETEYLASVSEADRPRALQELKVFDLNGDGKLSGSEFRSVPSRVPFEARSNLPSPFAGLVDGHLKTIAANWKKWDTDGNGKLSPREIQASGVSSYMPGVEQSPSYQDYLRGNHQIRQEDCRLLLEAAYGIRRLNGQLLHLPSGQVVYWWHFKELDRNRDERLSAAEFALESSDRVGREARFQQDDTDQDGEVSFAEWAASRNHRVDPVLEFLAFDTNLDGGLDETEMFKGTGAWLQLLTPNVFPGFDLNGDRKLSLDEYRATLLVNRVENWLERREDKTPDGKLSPHEFQWMRGIELSLLYSECFKRFDVDRNGFLSLKEFPFVVDPTNAPPETVFTMHDLNADGLLNIGEALGDLKPSTDTTQEATYRVLAQRVEEKFEHADTDHDDYISLAEFSTPLGRVVLDRAMTYQTWSVMNTINKRGEIPNRPWLITLLGINGVLMSGAILYLLIRH